jgi:hypothetical protein
VGRLLHQETLNLTQRISERPNLDRALSGTKQPLDRLPATLAPKPMLGDQLWRSARLGETPRCLPVQPQTAMVR